LFANKAKYLIWTYSKGIPRVINIICDNSLLIGYVRDQKRIDSSIVKEVMDDLNEVPLDNFDYPQGKSKDTSKEVSQTPLNKSDDIREASPELSEKKDGDSSDIVNKLRKKIFRNQESEPAEKKERRFSATWIAVIVGVAIIINIFILFLFFGSFKEFKNEFSSKLEAMKNNFQSQLGGIENSINKAPSGNKLTIPKSLPVSSPDVKDDREKHTVVVNKGETLYNIILRVYGKVDPKILDAILKINPEIKNPNFILENQVIKLPDKADLD
jgi:phage tail protein X